MNQRVHNSDPQRRWGDAPHDLIWGGKVAGAITAIISLLAIGMAFASAQMAAPISRKLDAIAERDSVRWAQERTERVNADGAVGDKLDLVIRLLTQQQHRGSR